MINRPARRLLTVGVVLAATAALLPPHSYEAQQPDFDAYTLCMTIVGSDAVALSSCSYGSGEVPSRAPLPPAPQPTRPATDGVPGCVTGPGRPVVGTTTPSYAVTFTAAVRQPIDVLFEEQPLDGSEDSVMSPRTAMSGEPVVLGDPEGWGLGPGESYRWRVSAGHGDDRVEPVWSDWCEFTVAAGLVDRRDATDLEAVRELGADPARRYRATMTVRQWRLVLEALDGDDDDGAYLEDFDDEAGESTERLRRMAAEVRKQIAGRAAGRRATVTLTGDEWASAAVEVAVVAGAADQMYKEEPESGDGSAYWKAVDTISAALGGPAHPNLGYR